MRFFRDFLASKLNGFDTISSLMKTIRAMLLEPPVASVIYGPNFLSFFGP